MSTTRETPMKMLLMAIAVTALCSCGLGPTRYIRNSNGFGYSESPVDSNTYLVTFHGNAATAVDDISRYTLYRAAELAVEKGYEYFLVLDDKPQASTFSYETYGYDGNQNWVPQTTVATVHSDIKTIRFVSSKPAADNASAYSAKSILHVMSIGAKDSTSGFDGRTQ